MKLFACLVMVLVLTAGAVAPVWSGDATDSREEEGADVSERSGASVDGRSGKGKPAGGLFDSIGSALQGGKGKKTDAPDSDGRRNRMSEDETRDLQR